MTKTDDWVLAYIDLDYAVRNYLSHLWAYEQGSEHDGPLVEYWRDEMQRLTGEDDE